MSSLARMRLGRWVSGSCRARYDRLRSDSWCRSISRRNRFIALNMSRDKNNTMVPPTSSINTLSVMRLKSVSCWVLVRQPNILAVPMAMTPKRMAVITRKK